MPGTRTVKVRFTGDTKDLDRATRSGQKAMGRWQSSFKKVAAGAALMGAAVGAAVVVGAKALLDLGRQFDDAFDTIRLGTGATGTQLKGLQKDFKAVLSAVPSSMKDVATAIADLNTRTGLAGPPLRELARQFLDLSRLTRTDITQNIRDITRIFGDWSIKTEDQATALDKLFRAGQATGIGINDLAGKVVQFGAPLRQIGFGFERSIALLAKWEKEGVNTELVLGGLRVALGKFARAGKDPAKALDDIIRRIQTAGSVAKGNKLAIEVFGARAGPDMAAAIREGRFAIGDLYKQIASGTETIQGAAKDTDDWREKWDTFTNRLKVVFEPAATGFFNAIGDGMNKLDELAKDPEISAWLADLKAQVGTIVDRFLPRFKEAWEGVVKAFKDNKEELKLVVEVIAFLALTIGETFVRSIGFAIQAIGFLVNAFKFLFARGSQILGNLLDAAVRAFGWIPGLGPKLKKAKREFDVWVRNINVALGNVQAVDIRITGRRVRGGTVTERAHGGPVLPFRDYLVGEGGVPEILRMGARGGWITPVKDAPARDRQPATVNVHLRAFSDRFSLRQVLDDLAWHGVH